MSELLDEFGDINKCILFGNQNSGHSYKVALSLTLMSISFDYRHISLKGPISDRPSGFLKLSRFGRVPVFVRGEQVIRESNAILLSLAESTKLLFGKTNLDVIAIREWLFWEASGIGFSLPNLRYLYLSGKENDPAHILYEDRLKSDLGTLELHLEERNFLVGNTLSIADLSCCGYLFWADQAGIKLGNWPNIEEWIKKISLTPNWISPTVLMANN